MIPPPRLTPVQYDILKLLDSVVPPMTDPARIALLLGVKTELVNRSLLTLEKRLLLKITRRRVGIASMKLTKLGIYSLDAAKRARRAKRFKELGHQIDKLLKETRNAGAPA